jgi:hypothetical protein
LIFSPVFYFLFRALDLRQYRPKPIFVYEIMHSNRLLRSSPVPRRSDANIDLFVAFPRESEREASGQVEPIACWSYPGFRDTRFHSAIGETGPSSEARSERAASFRRDATTRRLTLA